MLYVSEITTRLGQAVRLKMLPADYSLSVRSYLELDISLSREPTATYNNETLRWSCPVSFWQPLLARSIEVFSPKIIFLSFGNSAAFSWLWLDGSLANRRWQIFLDSFTFENVFHNVGGVLRYILMDFRSSTRIRCKNIFFLYWLFSTKLW